MRRRPFSPINLLYLIAFPLGMFWVERTPLQGPTLCPFRLLTQLDCPGCGLTRAFRAMGRLDVWEAFRYNPLGPIIFFVAVLLWGYAVAVLLSGGRVGMPAGVVRWRRSLLWAGLAFYLGVGFARMAYELRVPPPPPKTIPLPGFSRIISP
ncbi:MAG TPA: DUF2752 domain-containing protein [Armatimonadota bacterium]|jgi:hypothetical protein